MHASLSGLLRGVIDYAGLFPPAKLSMSEAMTNYLRYRGGENSWIVSRFICPVSRLGELEQELGKGGTPDCVPLSVVGTGGADISQFEFNLERDCAEMNRFEKAVQDKCTIEAFEIRSPSNADILQVIHDLEGFGEVDVFVELPWGEGMQEGLAALAESEWLGAKARTGGLEASAVPSPQELASFLRDCLHLDLPFKLTAGLHQPLYHFDASLGANAHGFLNVLCATALTEESDLSTSEIEEILTEQRPDAFVFGESGFGYGDLGASLEEIESIRALFVAIGSCSVDEPLEGLQKLKLVGASA
jgi:hypothetical protein